VTEPVLSIRDAGLAFDGRALWSGLDLEIAAGEFIAVLGPNGSGKSSLLKSILGLQPLSTGEITVLGQPAARGNDRVGYVPQQKLLEAGTPLRAKDLVALGLDGPRWGAPITSRSTRERVDAALAAVGASHHARSPIATLSGGEQQRVRIAQAIVSDPAALLCDEPLLSLDLAHQRSVSDLINEQRNRLGTAVVFVTHDVNPILGMVDRVLYLASGQFRIGTPDEVLRADVLSELYGTPVDVFRSHGRIVVIGGGDEDPHHHGEGD
jgi:zinc/manganese transport system ATP-binding protein